MSEGLNHTGTTFEKLVAGMHKDKALIIWNMVREGVPPKLIRTRAETTYATVQKVLERMKMAQVLPDSCQCTLPYGHRSRCLRYPVRHIEPPKPVATVANAHPVEDALIHLQKEMVDLYNQIQSTTKEIEVRKLHLVGLQQRHQRVEVAISAIQSVLAPKSEQEGKADEPLKVEPSEEPSPFHAANGLSSQQDNLTPSSSQGPCFTQPKDDPYRQLTTRYLGQ